MPWQCYFMIMAETKREESHCRMVLAAAPAIGAATATGRKFIVGRPCTGLGGGGGGGTQEYRGGWGGV